MRSGAFNGVDPRPRSFTLLELLIVVCVIAILLSLLLPAIQQATANARTSKCVSNLRQIGLASTQMMDDNNRQGFVWVYGTMGGMESYLGGSASSIRVCPETPPSGAPGGDGQSQTKTPYAWGGKWFSYAPNGWAYRQWASPNYPVWNSTYSIGGRGDASNPLYSDSRWCLSQPVKGTANLPTLDANGEVTSGGDLNRVYMWRHRQGINVAFFDGRVEKVLAANLNQLQWNRTP
ncbi:MAG: hypothetical protein RL095_2445 [Verrucomicrobiota bacterium]|jgi:prepilin-type processing-associated H-X9-DG protein